MELTNYLPIELIFNLLCVCRQLDSPAARKLRQAMYQRGLYYGTFDMLPRFSFWIKLCQSAALLDEQSPPRPTIFAPDWLAIPFPDQFRHLIDAWQNVPSVPRIQRIRQELPQMLLEQITLSQTHIKELMGLQALGICSGEDLTYFGLQILTETTVEQTPSVPKKWEIVTDEIHIPYPPDWALLWELEAYLNPIDPGIYSLDEESLRKAVQQFSNSSLLEILQRGLDTLPPQELVQRLENQPTLKVLPGLVLEFSSPEELLSLRQNASLRRDLAKVLSPHHVYINSWEADRILNRLQRLGLLSSRNLQAYNEHAPPSSARISSSEQAYLLSLMLISDGLGVNLAPPPGLLKKITEHLPFTLRASAARKASKNIKELNPKPIWLPEEELPPIPETQLIEFLENAIHKQQPIDIHYQKADQYQPEHRHLTPLIIEQRGLRFYLIAYCHTRRANRTFRLDRLQLLNEPPFE